MTNEIRLPLSDLAAKWLRTNGKKRRHVDKILMRGADWTPPPARRVATAIQKPPMNGARECARRLRQMGG